MLDEKYFEKYLYENEQIYQNKFENYRDFLNGYDDEQYDELLE